MLHHLAKAHEHIKKHTGNLLMALAHHHPILTTALALTGGALVVTKLTSSGAPATNVPAKVTTTTPPAIGA